ncbi:hypothetical protein HPB52_009425 [Rhipicephalus sanguineus]|uniref:Uncharacterized protein n=1 Tax=Rhipicephalus sanguineus TaxID=34632 RepID=A0A9D4YMM4_RHISA|nr:hypothetical protein HPB52_009425 [Rhipicephalus sanguineus]
MSNCVAKACFEFLDQLLHTWPTQNLKRHIAIPQETMKKRIDADAHAFSQKAFQGFADHLKEHEDVLLNLQGSRKPAARFAGRAVSQQVDQQQPAHQSTRLALEVLSVEPQIRGEPQAWLGVEVQHR